MPQSESQTEQHGCLVCGKIYFLEVTYGKTGNVETCDVLTPGGHQVADPHRALVACNHHSSTQIEDALTNHYPGAPQEEDEEE
jgi:hypothetical protein